MLCLGSGSGHLHGRRILNTGRSACAGGTRRPGALCTRGGAAAAFPVHGDLQGCSFPEKSAASLGTYGRHLLVATRWCPTARHSLVSSVGAGVGVSAEIQMVVDIVINVAELQGTYSAAGPQCGPCVRCWGHEKRGRMQSGWGEGGWGAVFCKEPAKPSRGSFPWAKTWVD